MDRTIPLTLELVDAALRQSVFGWKGRTPKLLLDAKGDVIGSDFDLLSFFVPLAERRAVIEIPEYQIRRPAHIRADERKVGSNQFGKIKGLTSNKDVFSFCVLINDQTIATEHDGEEELGAPRNYMLVDMTGDWGRWSEVRWSPTAEENRFLRERKLWQGDAITFEHDVHPNRWQSFFGAPYLLLKLLLRRIEDETSYYRSEVQRLADLGIVLAKETRSHPEAVGNTRTESIATMEAVLDVPKFSGSPADYPLPQDDTLERAAEADRKARLLAFKWRPRVQFVTRADECAFFRYGNGRVARWAKGLALESKVRLPRGRIDWERLTLSPFMALRWRHYLKTEQVAA